MPKRIVTMQKILYVFLPIFFFFGCNDIKYVQQEGTQTTQLENNLRTIHFIDDYVNNLNYKCSSGLVGITKDEGNITCPQNDTVVLYIGKVALPSVSLEEKFVTPYSFFDDINSSLNLARVLQSLDSTQNDNLLEIDKQKAQKLKENLDFTSSTFEHDVNGSLVLAPFDEVEQRLNANLKKLNLQIPMQKNNTINKKKRKKENNHLPSLNLSKIYSIYENQKFVTYIKALDDDNDTLTLSLSGEDAQSFEINTTNNALLFKKFPDYEKKTSYSVDVVVNDGYESVSKQIKVLILNVLDVSILQDTTLKVVENLPIGSKIGKVLFQSLGDSAVSFFDLNGSGSENFTIDLSGTIKTAKVLDYENIKNYNLMAKVITKDLQSSSANVVIDVINEADQKPILVPTVLNVLENSALKTVVGRVTIQTFGDSAITSMQLSGSDTFSILKNGDIILEKPLDYELCNEYNLSVSATNNAGESENISVKIFVNNILDLDEQLATTSLNIEENATLNTIIGNVIIEKQSDAKREAFNLIGDYSSYFDIDLNGVVRLKKALNYEQKDRYDLVAYTTTQIGQSNHVSVVINVLDVDEAPQLRDSQLNVYENALVGDTIGSIDIVFEGDTPINSIVLSGNGSENFSINKLGVVTLAKKLDYETTPLYTLNAKAINSIGESKSVDVNISVLNIVYNPFEVAKIVTDEDSFFGYSTAIDGDYFVYGAPFFDGNGVLDSGGVYLYKKNEDDSTTKLALLLPENIAKNDNFGYSVDIQYPYIVIGSPYDDTNESDSGAVYLFKIESDSNITQLAKIKGSSIAQDDHFGYSVSLDGNYVVVGAPGDNEGEDDAGAFYLFKIIDTTFQELQKVQASSRGLNDNFGSSVALSQDYIAVGSPNNDNIADDAGMAYLFKRESDTNVTQLDSFSNANEADNFGNSIDIDHNLILVGALKDDTKANNSGAAYVYKISDDKAVKVKKLTPSNLKSGDYFGSSVAVCGTKMVVGAYLSDASVENGGSVYSFYKNGDEIVQKSQLTLSSQVKNSFFGSDVAIDGNFVTVGAFGENSGYLFDGEAPYLIYQYSNQNLDTIEESKIKNIFTIEAASPLSNLTYKLVGDDATFFSINNSVISNSGKFDFENPQDKNKNNNYIFTALLEDKKGLQKNISFSVLVENLTYIFNKKETLRDGEVDDRFGYSIAANSDYVVVSIPNKESVDLYKNNNGKLTYLTTISADDKAEGDLFGTSVALYAKSILVGTQNEKVYWFEIQDDDSVEQKDSFSADDNEDGDRFGSHVALWGDYIVVGAPLKDDAKGALYLFKKDSTSVSEITKIKTGENSNDTLASSIAIYKNYIVAGSPHSSVNEDDGGVAYLFEIQDDDSVNELTQIDPDESFAYDKFATTVAINNTTIAIGTPFEDLEQTNSGAVYLFQIEDDKNVTQTDKIKSENLEKNALFGNSIALSRNFIAIGSTKSTLNAKVELYEINSTIEANYKQVFKADSFETSFGSSLYIDFKNLLIGSYKEKDSGVIYNFLKDNN